MEEVVKNERAREGRGRDNKVGRGLTAKIPPANNHAGIGNTKNSKNWVFGNIAAKNAIYTSALIERGGRGDISRFIPSSPWTTRLNRVIQGMESGEA